MKQNGNEEFAQPPAAEKTQKSQNPSTTKHNCDILLNNFQIKKKRHRVLLNYEHLVWEQLEGKGSNSQNDAAATTTGKEAEIEREQLSNRAEAASYGHSSNALHIEEIIRVVKGDTKRETKAETYRKSCKDFDGLASTGVQETPPTEQFLSIHYAERIVKSPTDCNRWRVRTLTLYNAEPYIVHQWYVHIQKMLNNLRPLRVRRLLVFINPYGGRKQGMPVYERYCKPIFELAGIDASCIISQRANQIRDILTSHDLTPFDAVCCVGGDGTAAEVINGLLFRTMIDLGMDARQPEFIPKPKLPIGIIPAGSTDTIAYSMHGTSDVRTAAIHLILGQRRGLDICSVRTQRQGIIRFCASVMSYGYLGDVAANSEKYRWMGTKRYEYTGAKAFLLNRGYEAEVSMLVPEEESSVMQSSSVTTRESHDSTDSIVGSANESICYANCIRCRSSMSSAVQEQLMAQRSVSCVTDGDIDEEELPTSSNSTLNVNEKRESIKVDNVANFNMTPDCDNKSFVKDSTQLQKDNQMNDCDSVILRSVLDSTLTIAAQNSQTFSSNSSLNNNTRKSMISETGHKWQVIKGRFFMICGANITCACARSPNGLSRYSHLGDGYLDLIFVRKTSLLNNVRLIMNTMGRNGDLRTLPFVDVYRTRKFTFRSQSMPLGSEEDCSIRGSCQPIADSFPRAQDEVPNKLLSSWNCDGEVVTDLDITMSSHCQLIDVFMRGAYSYSKPLKSEETSKFCCCTPRD